MSALYSSFGARTGREDDKKNPEQSKRLKVVNENESP